MAFGSKADETKSRIDLAKKQMEEAGFFVGQVTVHLKRAAQYLEAEDASELGGEIRALEATHSNEFTGMINALIEKIDELNTMV